MTAGWGAFNLLVRYGDEPALDDVTLAVPEGHVAAVVGGDGAGKTTLLRTLVRAVQPESGYVEAPALRDIGFMPTTSGVWRDLSVDENMAFVGSAYGVGVRSSPAGATHCWSRPGLVVPVTGSPGSSRAGCGRSSHSRWRCCIDR